MQREDTAHAGHDGAESGHQHHAQAHHDHVASATGQVEYTCPMHPEVRQMGPGRCPICGMNLQPVGAATAEGKQAHQRHHHPAHSSQTAADRKSVV